MLKNLRHERQFQVDDYIEAKSAIINSYFRTYGLKAAVVGTSGGIDSAIVVALINHASKQDGSPIEKIVPILMPVKSVGATNQDAATARGLELADKLGLEAFNMEITPAFNAAAKIVETALGASSDAWALGQLVSYQRTPILYYTTSVLSSLSLPAVVCGTTNRDEGAYLGYFGKASDGLVDLQIINDIHKSEVYLVAKALGVPQSIIDIPPTGDMYDERTDEEVFGVSYDFVELHHLLRTSKLNLLNDLSKKEMETFKKLESNVENMHRYNHHKYLGRSPAVHLDVLDGKMPGGWNYSTWKEAK